MDGETMANLLLFTVAGFGVIRHARNLLELRESCRDCSNAADEVLCRHYLRHESSRLTAKVILTLAAIGVLVDAIGLVGFRLLIVVVALTLDWESIRSASDRTVLTRIIRRGESEAHAAGVADEQDAQAERDTHV